MYLTAEFEETNSTAAAILALKTQGMEAQALDVFSTEPVEFAAGVLDRPSRMSLFAVAGAVALCLLSVGFVYYTQHDLPIITGGMPFFSFWATGVIFYEFALLGAIVVTFLTMLWESGLLRRSGPAPELQPGRIYLRVRCRPEQEAAAAESLDRAGTLRIERTESDS